MLKEVVRIWRKALSLPLQYKQYGKLKLQKMIPTENTFKTLLLAFISCCLMVAMQVQANVNDKLLEQRLCELDELLLHSDRQVRMQELRIAQCRSKQPLDESPEARYQYNMKLYQHYMVYDSDSAMCLINCNLQIAQRIGRKDWEADALIEKSFIYTATGMLKEAEDELKKIDTKLLSYESLLNYYGQRIYMYSHCSQYHGHMENALGNEYFLKEMA